MNHNFILAVMLVIAALVTIDMVTYMIRRAPKSSLFSRGIWIIGVICLIGLLYYYLNGFKF